MIPLPLSCRPRRRSPALLAILLTGVLLIGACGSPPVESYVAELVPFGESGVDTDLIFPRESGASRFLVRNWPPMQSVTGGTVWLVGSWAHIEFYTVADEPPTLVFEARPFAHPDAPSQLLTVLLNDTELESRAMPRRWETYEIPLPADHARVGWNRIELRFSESYRPADFLPGSDDHRSLTAEFRRIEMRGAAGRPRWIDRPAAVALSRDGETPGTTEAGGVTGAQTAADNGGEPAADGELRNVAIAMPTDSFFDAYIVPGSDGTVVGAASIEFEPGAAGSVHAQVDVFRPDGATEVWSTDFTSPSQRAEVSADLSPWAGEVVGLRLRVFGNANAVVRWEGLAVTGPTDVGDSLAPTSFVRAPTSGALGRPDVFLIILDAARADKFAGELGAELAPNIQALAADGTVFSRAWSPSSWTGQSIPAMWSGMTPDTAGIEHWGSRLPPEVTTFPELVFAAGYHTRLWSQHNIYRHRGMLRNGFEVFAEVDSADLTQREVLPDIADMLQDDRPTLSVIHLLPPHDPYLPPEPFRGSRSDWYQGNGINAVILNQFDSLYPEDQPEQRDAVRRAAIAKYEENVMFADHLVGRLIDELRRLGRYDDAMIVVTADHGEAFYEHGRFLHTSGLYEEFIRVPLVIKWPRSFSDYAQRVDTPVSLLDLAPTLTDGLGIDDERARYQGRSLLPLARGEEAPPRTLYAYTSGETSPENDLKPRYALLWNDRKLLHDARREHAAQLFRLSDDPQELTDLSLQEDFNTAWLMQAMRLARAHNSGVLLRLGGSQVEELDEETVRRLRALGYLR